MKRSISIIAAAAMAASLTLAGAVNAFADEEPTTQASTEAATQAEATLGIEDITGKWKYESDNQLYVGDVDDFTNTYAIGKEGGIVEIKSDSTYTFTKEGSDSETGTVKIGTEEISGTVLQTVSFYKGEELSFGGYYRDETDTISIGNGGTAQLVRVKDNAEETTTTTASETTTSTTTTTTATTTASTTTAKTTTAKATTASGSPKTGVAFPAIAVAGVGAAVATAFVLRKKEN